MITARMTCAALLVGFAGWAVAAADQKAVVERATEKIERSVGAKDGMWELKSSSHGPRSSIRVWQTRAARSDKGGQDQVGRRSSVTLRLDDAASPDKAAESLKERLRLAAAPLVGPLEELGDEAYLLGGGDENTACAIAMRQGSIVAWISAPSVSVAKQFAHYVVEGIAAADSDP